MIRTFLVLLFLTVGLTVSAQDQDKNATTENPSKNSEQSNTAAATDRESAKILSSPDLATIQNELEGLTPQERKVKLKEYRDKYGKNNSGPVESTQQISSDERKGLTAEQRSRYLQSWQKNRQTTTQLTPEQRQEQLKRTIASLDEQVRTLQVRQQVGTITDRESQMLDHLKKQRQRMNSRELLAPQFQGRTVPTPGVKSD